MMKRLLCSRRIWGAVHRAAPRCPRSSGFGAELLESRTLFSGTVGQILVVNNGTVGEYTTNGTTINASLLTNLGGGVNGITAAGSDVFVPNINSGLAGDGTVAEYTTSGVLLNGALISGLASPEGIALSGSDIYISDENTGSIGVYTNTGATVNAGLITGLSSVSSVQPLSIAVSGGDIFVLTSAFNSQNQIIGTISEYTTSGAIVNPSLVTGFDASEPEGIVVSGTGLFLVNHAAGTVSEYTTSGQLVNPALISGLAGPVGIAVFGSDLFVVNSVSNTIGEYTTTGAAVNPALISGVYDATWLTVETAPGPAAELGIGQQPSLTVAGQNISEPITVALEDANGNVETSGSNAVTLSIVSGPSGGVLTGTTTVDAVAGLATFSNLSFTRGGNYTLEATSTGLTSATSTPIDAIVGYIDQANLDDIIGWAYNPANPQVSVGIEIDIQGGAVQQITANQQRADLQSVVGNKDVGFEYSTPMMTTGSHQVYIYAEEPGVGNVLIGQTTLVSQNGLFDTHYYDENNPGVVQEVQDGTYATAYDQFLAVGQHVLVAEAETGAPETASPSPYWNEQYYLEVNPDVQDAVTLATVSSGFMHYYLYGQYENRFGLEWFSPDFYLTENPDVAAAVQAGTVTSAFEHFCDFGQYEGRDPIGQIIGGQAVSYFQTALYEESNTDILNYITGEPYSSAYEQFVETGLSDTGVAGSGAMAVQTGRFWTLNWSAVIYYNYQTGALTTIGEGNVQGLFENFLEWGQYLGYYAGQ